MRLKEQRLWDTFRRRGKDLWLQRIENIVMAGMPDVYDGRGKCWVELKAPTAPKRSATRVLGNEGLNRDQVNWHLKAHAHKVRCYILIRDDSARLWLVEGKWAEELNDMTAEELDYAAVANDWHNIIKILRGE